MTEGMSVREWHVYKECRGRPAWTATDLRMTTATWIISHQFRTWREAYDYAYRRATDARQDAMQP